MVPSDKCFKCHELCICPVFCVAEEEKGLVEEVFNNAIDSLSDEDKKLPQVGITHS